MEAVIEAIAAEMRRDERICYIGQDVGRMGGAMQGTKGLYDEFGDRRVRDAPISESAMVGVALGAALFGRRPIVEISFGEFLPAAMNQLINQAPNLHYMTGGAATRAGSYSHARRGRPVRRPPAGLLRLVRPCAGPESGDARDARRREGHDDRRDSRR